MISIHHIFDSAENPLRMAPSPALQVQPLTTPGALPDQVTQALMELIRSGSYSPKSRLQSKAHVAQHFGAGRTAIRDAVSRLKSERLVEAQQEETRLHAMQEHQLLCDANSCKDPETVRTAAGTHVEMSPQRIRSAGPALPGMRRQPSTTRRTT